MMQQVVNHTLPPKPYTSAHSISEEHMQAGRLPLAKGTKPEAQYSHRFSDYFYEYDVENGTQLNERKISIAYSLLALTGGIVTIGTYTPIVVLAVSFIVSPFCFFLVPMCVGVVAICALIFHTYVTSESSQQHSKQILGPKTQEQAEALQCQAVEVCKQKQAELNDLQAVNDAIKTEMSSFFESDTCKSTSKCKNVWEMMIHRKNLVSQHSKLLHQYLVNKDKLAALETSLVNLGGLYHLSTHTDKSTGNVGVDITDTVSLEGLPT